MTTNKLTLELELPTHDGADYDSLEKQAAFIVRTWKALMSEYKGPTPSIYLRSKKPAEKSVNTDAQKKKEFVNTLLDYHKQFMPQDDLSKQAIPVNQLFATGLTAEQLIAEYDKSRADYKLTSWFTVRHRLATQGNKAEERPGEFVRSEITDDAKEDLKKRLEMYSPLDERRDQGTT